MSVPWSLKRTVDPTTGPITLTEAKSHIRVVSTGDDTYLGTLIEACTERAEQICNRSFMKQTHVMKLDMFPSGNRPMRLPMTPLLSVSSVSYTTSTGGTTSWSSTAYDVDTNSEPGRIGPKSGEIWPVARDQIDAVTITYLSGYSSSTSETTQQAAIPERAKLGIKQLIADAYADRETVIVGTISSVLKSSVATILQSYKVPGGPKWYG